MTLAHFLLTCFSASAYAHDFLKPTSQVMGERISETILRDTLLQEIEGTGTTAKRVKLLEAILLSSFNALPKNEHGKLGHSAVRYALHRLFVMRHGWSIKALHSSGAKWNSSSPAGVLAGQAPSHVQDLFEDRLGGQGLGLKELAVLAATVEHLMHNEIVGKLAAVFELKNIELTTNLTETEADEVFDAYMSGFILGRDLSNTSLQTLESVVSFMPQIFTGWSEAQAFVKRIRRNITSGVTNAMSFDMLEQVAEVVSQEYGSFQNIECQEMKKTLMHMGDPSVGRVKLVDFYKPALEGTWQFQESLGYLRQLGALDESDPTDISIIIPNYLHSETNCLPSSAFYSICCKNECEGLFGHLEETLAAPEVRPELIAALVAKLPSATTKAPRKITGTLLSRLHGIAREHGGMVPIHGRLFAQWMHHAFPRECPYPHLSGTTSQQSVPEWIAESGSSHEITHEEILQYTRKTLAPPRIASEELLHWSTEEELLVVRPADVATNGAGSIRLGMRNLALVVALASLAFNLLKSLKQQRAANTNLESSKYVV